MEDELQDAPDHAGCLSGARAGDHVQAIGRARTNNVPLAGIEGVSAVGFVDRSEWVEPGHDSHGRGEHRSRYRFATSCGNCLTEQTCSQPASTSFFTDLSDQFPS